MNNLFVKKVFKVSIVLLILFLNFKVGFWSYAMINSHTTYETDPTKVSPETIRQLCKELKRVNYGGSIKEMNLGNGVSCLVKNGPDDVINIGGKNYTCKTKVAVDVKYGQAQNSCAIANIPGFGNDTCAGSTEGKTVANSCCLVKINDEIHFVGYKDGKEQEPKDGYLYTYKSCLDTAKVFQQEMYLDGVKLYKVDPAYHDRVTEKMEMEAKFNKKSRKDYKEDLFCFTKKQCDDVNGIWKGVNSKCKKRANEGRGYCGVRPPEYDLQNPVLGVGKVQGLRNYIGLMYKFIIGASIVGASLMFIIGAFMYMFSGVSGSMNKGKGMMLDAVIGLVLIFGAYLILDNINPNTLKMKPLEVNMINRAAFYDVVFCKDIKDKSLKYLDAGTPDNPKDFSVVEKEKFNVLAKDTKCGHDYFIEGALANNTCTGAHCPKGRICLNCSGEVSAGCKTNSAYEFRCANCKTGGTINSAEGIIPKKTTYYVYCAKGTTSEDYEDTLDVKELGSIDLKAKKVGRGDVSGSVAGFCFGDNDGKSNTAKFISANEVKEFEEKCKQDGKQGDMGMFRVDQFSISLGRALKDIGWNDIEERFLDHVKTGAGIGAAAGTSGGLVGAIPGALVGAAVGGVYSLTKNFSLSVVVGSASCGKNLSQGSLLLKGSLDGEDALKQLWKMSYQSTAPDQLKNTAIVLTNDNESPVTSSKPTAYKIFHDTVWNMSYAKDMLDNKNSQACSINFK